MDWDTAESNKRLASKIKKKHNHALNALNT